MKKMLLFAILAIALTGCVMQPQQKVVKNWYELDGSRGDAIVKLGMDWDTASENPDFNFEQAKALATQTCQKWSYASAEPFQKLNSRCLEYYRATCLRRQALLTFQCIDSSGTHSVSKANGQKRKP